MDKRRVWLLGKWGLFIDYQEAFWLQSIPQTPRWGNYTYSDMGHCEKILAEIRMCNCGDNEPNYSWTMQSYRLSEVSCSCCVIRDILIKLWPGTMLSLIELLSYQHLSNTYCFPPTPEQTKIQVDGLYNWLLRMTCHYWIRCTYWRISKSRQGTVLKIL